MAIDLKQFHQIFIEECAEGLDVMEASLMALNAHSLDSDTINAIFRSAHSIKGGAGTFGFTALADFTHVLETLLDEVRSAVRSFNHELIDLLLKSVDCMRNMLELIQQGRNEYTAAATDLKRILEQFLAPVSVVTPDNGTGSGEQTRSHDIHHDQWLITFSPHKHFMQTGNDPLRIVRELAELTVDGSIHVTLIDCSTSFICYTPDECYCTWEIILSGANIDALIIKKVFEWVVNDCDLSIKPHARLLPQSDAQPSIWCVTFLPDPRLFQTGNDPLRIFSELDRECELISCCISTQKLPSLHLMDSEKCYLSWRLCLAGNVEKSVIEEAFEWVTDEADITIERHLQTSEMISSCNNHLSELGTIDGESRQESMVSAAPQVGREPSKLSSKKSRLPEASSIRVGTDKVDSLIDMVGELVITQSMLGQLGENFDMQHLPKLIEGLNQLEQNTRELQESVMRIRMLPMSFTFSRFPRMVRDLSQELNKKIDLVLCGESTELDKTVMEKIGDPLVHLVRNSIDHGIESPAERLCSGKKEEGTVTLNAYHQGGHVVIEVTDDGRGLDRDNIAKKGIERGLLSEQEALECTDDKIFDLIFQPGFSTAKAVSALSGRGVGMDVVKRNIQVLNGTIEISSVKNEGTKIKISLPLTLAILDGQLVRVGSEIYVFPLVSIVESIRYCSDLVSGIAGGFRVLKLRDEYVPIVELAEILGGKKIEDYSAALMVVVDCDSFKVAMVVDELMAQQQVVIKSLEKNYKPIEGISGATILGDGTVALIIDTVGVVKLAGAEKLHHKYSLCKTG
ncbi:chemotaxis protein CheA [Marinagarivorans algicola]|uniref:chemotaxis protein CheA n=1 Tax=Marinagarivorans algicola TaxID=1513270 RepID=UPI0006B4B03D|nr:chemotaxis protein CheA [Marinagarivorans algicola]